MKIGWSRRICGPPAPEDSAWMDLYGIMYLHLLVLITRFGDRACAVSSIAVLAEESDRRRSESKFASSLKKCLRAARLHCAVGTVKHLLTPTCGSRREKF
jgi:hypothetical protein